MKPVPLLLLAVLIASGCAAELPVHEPEPVQAEAIPCGLISIAVSGPQPANLELDRERAVVFLNTTGQELVQVRVWGSLVPKEEGHLGELLEPGAAMTFALPRGGDLRFEVSRSLGQSFWGRIRRSSQ